MVCDATRDRNIYQSEDINPRTIRRILGPLGVDDETGDFFVSLPVPAAIHSIVAKAGIRDGCSLREILLYICSPLCFF